MADQEMTAPHKGWDDLSAQQKEQVAMALRSLEEFAFGCERLRELGGREDVAPAELRFFVAAVYQYVTNLVLVKKAKLPSVLSDIGCTDLAEEIVNTTEVRVGGAKVGDVVRWWRNSMFVHHSYELADADKVYLKAALDLEDPEQLGQFAEAVEHLTNAVTEVFVRLRERYPEPELC